MNPRLPAPNPSCVAGVAFTLSQMTSHNAAEGIEMIRQRIFEGLLERDWEMEDAAKFAVLFVIQVEERMHQIVKAVRQLH